MQALGQMSLAEKQRSRRQIQLKPSSRNRKKRGNVIFGSRSQPHDFRIDELFTSKPGLSQEPPYSRMKPEHRGYNFFNNSHQPVPASDVEQLVTCNSVLPCRTQAHEELRQQNNRA